MKLITPLRVAATFLAAVLVLAPVVRAQSGPFSAQIQRLLHSANIWTATQTFANIVVSGCTGCGGGGGSDFTTNVTITKADPAVVYDGPTVGDSDGWQALIPDGDGTVSGDYWEVGRGTVPGTNPELKVHLVPDGSNGRLMIFNILGNQGDSPAGRMLFGTTSVSNRVFVWYKNEDAGPYKILTLGTGNGVVGADSSIDITDADVDPDRTQCFAVNNGTRTWCAGTSTSWFPNADNSGSIGLVTNAIKNIWSYKFIAGNTVPPSIAGNATLNTGSADSAGKVTATGTGASTAVITFGTAFARAPACYATNETTAVLARAVSTTSTLSIAGALVSGDVVSYGCLGY